MVKHCNYRDDRRLKQKNLCFKTFQQRSLDMVYICLCAACEYSLQSGVVADVDRVRCPKEHQGQDFILEFMSQMVEDIPSSLS